MRHGIFTERIVRAPGGEYGPATPAGRESRIDLQGLSTIDQRLPTPACSKGKELFSGLVTDLEQTLPAQHKDLFPSHQAASTGDGHTHLS